MKTKKPSMYVQQQIFRSTMLGAGSFCLHIYLLQLRKLWGISSWQLITRSLDHLVSLHKVSSWWSLFMLQLSFMQLAFTFTFALFTHHFFHSMFGLMNNMKKIYQFLPHKKCFSLSCNSLTFFCELCSPAAHKRSYRVFLPYICIFALWSQNNTLCKYNHACK